MGKERISNEETTVQKTPMKWGRVVLLYMYYRFYCLSRKIKGNNEFEVRTVALNLSNLPICLIFIGGGMLLLGQNPMLIGVMLLFLYVHFKLYDIYPMDLNDTVVVFKARKIFDLLIAVYYCLSITFFIYSLDHNRKYGSIINPIEATEEIDETSQKEYLPDKLSETEILKGLEELRQQSNTNSSQ